MLFIDVYLQKAIKEKDIPIEGLEFMGPSKEKADSWYSSDHHLISFITVMDFSRSSGQRDFLCWIYRRHLDEVNCWVMHIVKSKK